MSSNIYDVIVVGGGIIGRSTALQIKETNKEEDILLIDQFSMSQSFGSSKGRSKGVQRANWNKDESDAMKKMKDDSIIEWERLEHISSRSIVTKSKALFIGPAESAFMRNTLTSLKKYSEGDLMKSIDTLQQDYPKINFSDNCVGILDTSELCLGADEILKDKLKKHAMEEYWKLKSCPETTCPSIFEYKDKSIIWTNYTTEYGPSLKIGYSGKEISEEDLNNVISMHDKEMIVSMTKYVKCKFSKLISENEPFLIENCMYTSTKDRKPIIGRHPERGNIFLAVGMSGTGFGYSPAISNIVCDLVLGKEPKYDISEFCVTRSSLKK